jgi:hypothetical protein
MSALYLLNIRYLAKAFIQLVQLLAHYVTLDLHKFVLLRDIEQVVRELLRQELLLHALLRYLMPVLLINAHELLHGSDLLEEHLLLELVSGDLVYLYLHPKHERLLL